MGQSLPLVIDAAFTPIYLVILLSISPLLTMVVLSTLPLIIGLTLIANPIYDPNQAVHGGIGAYPLVPHRSHHRHSNDQIPKRRTQDPLGIPEPLRNYLGEDFKLRISRETIGNLAEFIQGLNRVLVIAIGTWLVMQRIA